MSKGIMDDPEIQRISKGLPKSPPAGDELTLAQMIKAIYDSGHFDGRWAAKGDYGNTGRFDVWEAKVNAYILAEVLKLVDNAPPHTERRYNYYEECPEYIPMVDKEDVINAAQARFGGKEGNI